MTKALAIIPARGGSKGIPKKNITLVAGKPLIAWTIEEAKKSGYFSQIIVSSDNEEILAVAKKFGAKTLKRPTELASDTAQAESVLTHALRSVQVNGVLPPLTVYLQPTSPLRTAKHLKNAINLFSEKKADTLISVCRIDNKLLKAFVTTPDGYLSGISNNNYATTNRQQLPAVYLPNGAIYILKSQNFLNCPRFFGEKTVPFIMTPEESIDMDYPEDITAIEAEFKKRNLDNEK